MIAGNKESDTSNYCLHAIFHRKFVIFLTRTTLVHYLVKMKTWSIVPKSPPYSWYCNTLHCTYTVYFLWLQRHHATAPKRCPGQWCSFAGVLRTVSGHWRSVHDRELFMHYCLFPRCSYKQHGEKSLLAMGVCPLGIEATERGAEDPAPTGRASVQPPLSAT